MIKTVKKLSKKSLAILIALLMIISVMPLTPPISVEAADVSSIQNLKFDKATATGKGYHYGSEATGGYDNILYCSQTPLISNNKYSEVRNLRCKTFSPTVVVGLYDGTTTGFPVVLETKSYKWLTTTNEFALRYISWNGDSRLTLKRPWYGYHKSAYQTWPTESSTKIPVTSTKDTSMSQKDTTSRFFNNEIYYNGSGNAETYYDEITGTKYYIDVNGHDGSDSCSGTKMIVLDYNRFYSIVDTVKDIQKKLVDAPDRYTATSATAAINAIQAYYNANQRVKNDFSNVNDTNAATTAISVATDMKNAVAAINAVNLECAHNKTRIVGAVQATCVTAGETGTTYCEYCNVPIADSLPIAAKGHSFTNYVSDNNATCIKDGTKTAKCDRCDATDTKTDEGTATGVHNYTEFVSGKQDATCSQEGKEAVYKCATCEATNGGDVIPIDSNNHTGLTTIPAVEATCTSTGLTEGQKCTACGVTTIEQQTVEMKAHDWGDWVYDADKKEKRTCKDCGTVDSEKRACEYVEKPGTPATCIAEGKRVYRCTQCGNEYEEILPVDSEAHSTATRVETTNATCTTAGKKETVTYCTLCNKEIGREKTEDIPALEHDFTVFEQLNADSHTVKCSRDCDEEGSTYTEPHDMDGNTCTKCKYIAKVTITFKDKDGNVISSAEYAIGVSVTAPALPAKENNYNGDGTHTVVTYAWDSVPQTTAQTEATYTVVSSSETVDCTYGDTATRTETVGKDTYDIFTCTVCGSEMQKRVADKTALNAAIVALQNDLDLPEAGYKYDAARVQAAKALITEANALGRYEEQSVVNAKAEAIATAKTELNAKENLAKYTITFEIFNEDSQATVTTYTEENVPYGDTITFNKDLLNDENGNTLYVVYKWTKKVNNKDSVVNAVSKDFSVVVKENATYYCNVLNFNATTEGEQQKTRVRFVDKSGRTLAIDWANIDEEYNLEQGLSQNSVTVPAIPYYDFKEWKCVSGNAQSVDENELVFRATYEYSKTEANQCQIVGKNGALINGKGTYTGYYDEKVTLTGGTHFAICNANGDKIIADINMNYIYVPHINAGETLYITVVETASEEASTAITGYFTQANAGGITSNGAPIHRLYVNAQYYLPEGATAVEAGFVLSRSATDADSLQIGKDKVSQMVSDSQGANHEYTIYMGFTANNHAYVRAYLIYLDQDGVSHTVYSDVMRIDYSA